MNYNEYLQFCLDAALDIKAGNFDNSMGICGNIYHKVIHCMGVKFTGYVIDDNLLIIDFIEKEIESATRTA